MTDRLNVNKTADIWTALPDILGDLMKPDRRIDQYYIVKESRLTLQMATAVKEKYMQLQPCCSLKELV